MVGPWISYLEVLQKAQVLDMGDIEYLSIKEFDGKVRSDEGSLAAPGTLATLTANIGKDMYLGHAKLSWRAEGGDFTMLAELSINGVVIESYTSGQTAGGTSTTVYEFKNIGRKVATGEIIKIELITFGGAGAESCEGMIECFEEDTGATPQIPSI